MQCNAPFIVLEGISPSPSPFPPFFSPRDALFPPPPPPLPPPRLSSYWNSGKDPRDDAVVNNHRRTGKVRGRRGVGKGTRHILAYLPPPSLPPSSLLLSFSEKTKRLSRKLGLSAICVNEDSGLHHSKRSVDLKFW